MGHFRTPNSKVRKFQFKRRPFRLPILTDTSTTSSRHGDAASPPVQAPAIPPSEGEVPSQRRYPTRRPPTEPVPPAEQAASSVSRPPAKRTKFSGPGEPSHALQSEPPTEDSRIPVGITPETVIRRPMIAGPPIEGNLDCRDRSFHSETYFDIEALRQQPELRDSFRLLQRYHMESLLTPRQFYYPRVVLDFYQSMTTRGLRNPTLIQFTIDGRQGAIGARHIAEALRGLLPASVLTRRELPSGMLLIDVLLRANIFPLQHKVQRSGAILEALFRISEGYFFGPHHLIMTSLLHFEEKVHQKKLQRADGIPLLFPRLLCQILEHLGYPEEPRLRGAAIAERFLSRQMASLAHTSVHMPEAIHPSSPLTQGAPPVVPATPPPPPSSEPTITIFLMEFRGLERSLRTLSTAQDSIIHQMATIRTHQDQIIATQAQHTTILHQIQQHLSMQTPFGHDRSAPSEPLVPDEESLPAEQPIPEEQIRAEPSHDPTTI
ncbi:hypothetical protein CK203_064450 [Vitis vinifera]|uniref:Uncharacterized protein n=1 Tax=Vitis vinifera TaxID=29760 RepID=A0A438GAA5_VITVI|nr:hypothetical protein CK203_064450 [Vitis vinifera]